MNSRHIFLWPIIISLIAHAALIFVSSIIDLRTNVRAAEIFNVQITAPDEVIDPGADRAAREDEPAPQEEAAMTDDSVREDTVHLGDPDVKYAQYLSGFKRKIQRIWAYPATAYARRDEGTSVVRISVNADGTLSQIALVSSSGSTHLDEGTLATVQSAAPFAPLPESYNLTRLHVVASFRYRMTD
ncbi:MAG: TonB family protein [Smithellaceae bacterium]